MDKFYKWIEKYNGKIFLIPICGVHQKLAYNMVYFLAETRYVK